MRHNRENQLPLTSPWPDHQLAQERIAVSKILEDTTRSRIWNDTICVTESAPTTGLGAFGGAGAALGRS